MRAAVDLVAARLAETFHVRSGAATPSNWTPQGERLPWGV